MAFQQGTATSVSDLFSQLKGFATSNGWTADSVGANTDRLFLHHTASASVYMGFRWDLATPANVGIFQALGYINSSTAPGNQTNDSGQGVISGTNATIDDGRYVPLVDSSMPYWFFHSNASAAIHYIHVVAQTAAGQCAHFGFGSLAKIGDLWTGGEYSYGHAYKATDQHGAAVNSASSFLLDALCDTSTGAPYRASVHMEGIPNQGSSKWGVVGNFASTGAGTDRGSATRTKILGGFRGGFIGREFGRIGSNSQVGLVPIYPIPVAAFTNDGVTDNAYLLGEMYDVGGFNTQWFELGDTVQIGADTWYLFPTVKKSGDDVAGSAIGSSYWQGIAYRKSNV